MLKSKKFIAAIVGVIIALVSKLGIELDTEAVALVVSPILAYIVGQGVADHGKERAQIIVNNVGQELDYVVDNTVVDDTLDVELRP